MQNLVNTYLAKFRNERRTRRRLTCILLVLALVVGTGVYWQMHLTGVTAANEVFCGKEEHVHDDGCYRIVLACNLEEAEEAEGHTHTEDCYEEQLVCGLEEHTHTVDCLTDPSADVEDSAVWEATLPDLTGVWANDVVAVARSQVGYTESTSNFVLDEDGETIRGYTRYGDWAGNDYGVWDAMFASFCLYYAGISEDDFPESTGSYVWAALLKNEGLYEAAENYTPTSGDLVFFDSDRNDIIDSVGIIADVNAESRELTVIKGDYTSAEGTADTVAEIACSMDDSSIVGYGILPEEAENEVVESEIMLIAEEDVSGTDTAYTIEQVIALYKELPAVEEIYTLLTVDELDVAYQQMKEAYEAYCSLSEEDQEIVSTDTDAETEKRMNALFTAYMTRWMDLQEYMDMFDYVTLSNGIGIPANITYTFTDSSSSDLLLNEDGGYSLITGETYNVFITFYADILVEGAYVMTLPEEIAINSYTTELNYNMGTCMFDAENTLLLFKIINEAGNNYSLASINASVSFYFERKGDYTFFDDVKVEVKPGDPEEETDVSKTGNYDEKLGKLTWNVVITGKKHSIIAGNVIIDTITSSDTHFYSVDDMTNGVIIDAYYYENDSETVTESYEWTVTNFSEGMIWTSSGWSYTMPENVICTNGDSFSLPTYGAENWVFVLHYTSTVTDGIDMTKVQVYGNKATMEGEDECRVMTIPEAGVSKSGEFVVGETLAYSYIEWTVNVFIPGVAEGSSVANWMVEDDLMRVLYNSTGEMETIDLATLDNLTIKATIDSVVYEVPLMSKENVSKGYPILYDYASTNYENESGYGTHKGVYICFYTLCNCTSEENCSNYYEFGGEYDDCMSDYGYCLCWDLTSDVTITITYRTYIGDNFSNNVIDMSNSVSSEVDYSAIIYNHINLTRGKDTEGGVGGTEDEDEAEVEISKVFAKSLLQAPSGSNDYVAMYEVYIDSNSTEEWEGLSEIIITDSMSESLTIFPTSIVITWEDEDGTMGVLDTNRYTVTYSISTAEVTDEDSESENTNYNIVTFTILNPGAHDQYTINYSAQLNGSGTVRYSNSAEIDLDGVGYKAEMQVKTVNDVISTAKYFSAILVKVDESNTTITLEGAKFNVFEVGAGDDDSDMILISGITDDNGQLEVKTLTSGENPVILREHTLYYFVEAEAPENYTLDTTKHYFWFCENHGLNGTCETCKQMADALEDKDYISPVDTGLGVTIAITVENARAYTLPSTGGNGTWAHVMVGILLIFSAAGLLLGRRSVRL